MQKRLILVLFVALALVAPSTASAGLGVVGWLLDLDDVGRNSANELSAAIDRATNRLLTLQNELDLDVTRYLRTLDEMRVSLASDIEDIIQKSDTALQQRLAQANDVIQGAIGAIEDLEQRAVYDARKLLWDSECIAERVLTDTLKRALGETVSTINNSNSRLELKILGFRAGQIEPVIHEIPVTSPYKTYERIRAAYEKELASMTGGTSARSVMRAYDDIARIAKLTSCHYQGQATGATLLKDYVDFSNKAWPWALIITGTERSIK